MFLLEYLVTTILHRVESRIIILANYVGNSFKRCVVSFCHSTAFIHTYLIIVVREHLRPAQVRDKTISFIVKTTDVLHACI